MLTPRCSDRTVRRCSVQLGVFGLYHAKYISRAVIAKQFFSGSAARL